MVFSSARGWIPASAHDPEANRSGGAAPLIPRAIPALQYATADQALKKTQQRQVGQISMGSTLQFHLMVATISPLMSSGTHSEPSRDHAFQLSTTELCENSYGTILERSWNYPGTTSELRRNRPFILCFHGFLSGQFLLPVPLIKILLKAQGVGTTSRERARTGGP